MLNTPIFIPSRSRADKVGRGILSKLPKELHEHITFVIPYNQGQDYFHALEKYTLGIAKTREFIGRYAKEIGKSKFIMIDDDITDFAVRIRDDDTHLRKAEEGDIIEMFEWVESALDDYAHVSVSPRGNNLIMKTKGPLVGPKPLIQENVRTLRLLAYQTDKFLSVEHGRTEVMEDFDVNLQLLEKGYKNVQSYHWTQDQRQTALPGGCADYRSLELQDRSAKKLQELHPEFVKLRTKVNKSKVTHNKEFTTRTEVTIAWKKSYERSLKIEKSA
jgi:hypothetical protein